MGIQPRKGIIYIKGRCKNMILTGSGQNIYPEEIEDLILQLPYITETLVVGRNHALVVSIPAFLNHSSAFATADSVSLAQVTVVFM